jgi:hypothetical protein
MWMLREIERIHLHSCYNIPDYTSMEYNFSDITSKHAEETIDIPLFIYSWKILLKVARHNILGGQRTTQIIEQITRWQSALK